MTDNKETRIKAHFSELNKFIDCENYSKIVRTANKILSESENEVKAWQCKLTALIHLGQFQEALQTLKKCKVGSSLLFEKAYCEYRLNDTNAAWQTISNSPDSPRVRELKAQILYRLERYDECYAVYRDLVKNTSDQYDQERLTNFAAVAVNLSNEGSSEKGFEPDPDASYEQVYNKGCELLSRDMKEDALIYLQKAESLCRKSLQADGATEDEIVDEVAIIRVQQGYCLQLMKKEREALSIYNDVLKTKPEDPALLAIINNNIVAINRELNVFDSKKRFKAALAPGLEHKLTSLQRSYVALNHCLLALYTNQEDLCESEANRLIKLYPRHALAATIIRAALRGRNSKVDEATVILKKYAASNPESALVAYLSATQILLSQGCVEKAIELLLALTDADKFKNGIVSALIVLYSALGKMDDASKILREAVQWNKQKKVSESSNVGTLLRHASDFHLRNGDVEVAADCLEELRKLNVSDVNTLAQLISAYCQFDTAKAQELSKALPDGLSLVKNVDADLLESSFAQKYAKKVIIGKAAEPSPITPGKNKASPGEALQKGTKDEKKKKKAPRLPKNYVEGSQPDPERWLPRWERQGYKKKRDRRTKDAGVGKGTQGVSSDVADKFDITKTASQHRSSHTVPLTDSSSVPRRGHQKKKGGAKKKKN